MLSHQTIMAVNLIVATNLMGILLQIKRKSSSSITN